MKFSGSLVVLLSTDKLISKQSDSSDEVLIYKFLASPKIERVQDACKTLITKKNHAVCTTVIVSAKAEFQHVQDRFGSILTEPRFKSNLL